MNKLQANLQTNVQYIQHLFGNSVDVVFREVKIGANGNQTMAIIYIDGLVDHTMITQYIMEATMMGHSVRAVQKQAAELDPATLPSEKQDWVTLLKERVLTLGNVKNITDFQSICQAILSGETVILLDGYPMGLAGSTQGWEKRAISEATTECALRGPREAFTETLRTNTSLIRRRIKHCNLRIETTCVGRLTQTDVAIVYIYDLADKELVQEVNKRINRIDIDGILESGYIEEFIQDNTFSPFPTIFNTERPDVVAAALLEGKVAIIIDGTPFSLIVPAPFISFLHAAEDYYFRADMSSFIRIIRYIGFFITLLGPSLYVAITTFHQEMLPTPLLISLAAQREGVPFPAVIETMMTEILFELLREAGVRMPRIIGPAVSVVGTLVIGQAAVEAGIISAAMVIVVSTTAICSFVFPSYSMSNAFRILRFPLVLLAGSFGLFGIFIGLIAIVLHLCSLRTFDVPYMTPFAPFRITDQQDAIFRFPWWAMWKRPSFMSKHNKQRVAQSVSQRSKSRQ